VTGVFLVRDLGAGGGGAICLAGVGSAAGGGAAARGVLGFLGRDLGAAAAGAGTLVLDAAAGVVLLTLAIGEWETLAVIGESRREEGKI
jgi:hypothetical protein